MTETLTIRRPDDWHLHFRDGAMMRGVVPYTARQFARAIVMPNLTPPVTTTALGAAYRERILAAVPEGVDFRPLMTAYLTDETDADDLIDGYTHGVFTAAKLYPANATTNSASGVTDVEALYPVFERMAAAGMVLCIHGEVTDADVDVFDREKEFIERTMAPLHAAIPALKIAFEHITTSDAVDFVVGANDNIGATITPQHLHINRNAMLVGGIQPHNYCLPVAKRETHRLALRQAATSGPPKFFLGTDSAPHEKHTKESACGCAGIFGAPYALESYLAVFEEEDALDKFEAFASLNGPAFYGLPVNDETITLERVPHNVPDSLETEGGKVVPFHAGQELNWRLK
ncbi:dihydroorotase [Erythrobacter litoralis]|uniref:Dihydroorotase n=1 Tax=Erythrobacter litoralis (strain HTCC2594) TaxID=314225 RepID=PYRC_ERYLH|nr:dihydroorotase [Erythrobacter litoralis]Q2NCC9.1 RecName: Full=Dihydroorotase; Short=DHOase [Erythrobacter litoralis HTCC2594]ABC62662.1 Dihydroorotase [Erythrobacter litoralis HTCC2594]